MGEGCGLIGCTVCIEGLGFWLTLCVCVGQTERGYEMPSNQIAPDGSF